MEENKDLEVTPVEETTEEVNEETTVEVAPQETEALVEEKTEEPKVEVEATEAKEEPKADQKQQRKPFGARGNAPRRDFKKPEKKQSEFIDQVVSINRVTKVTKGGRQMRFSATVVIGNKKGKVGLGTGKAGEAPVAVAKAIDQAQKNLITVPIVNGTTIPHEAIGVSGAGKVMLKPALKGTGVKAGGPVRAVLELAGIHDILSKSLGSNTKINMVHATFDALKQMRTAEDIAVLRGKTVEEILG